jgi:hypothetical protein
MMKFLARLGRLLCGGMFLRVGPSHFEFETPAGEKSPFE